MHAACISEPCCGNAFPGFDSSVVACQPCKESLSHCECTPSLLVRPGIKMRIILLVFVFLWGAARAEVSWSEWTVIEDPWHPDRQG